MQSILKPWIVGALVLFLSAAGGGRSLAANPPSALEFYRQAIKSMDAIKEPAYVTFRLESTSHGLRGDFQRCNMYFCISPGNNTDRWTVWHRTNDFTTAILDTENDHRYVNRLNFFDPTWYGVYHGLTEGMMNVPQETNAALPSPTPTPDASMRTIAAISVFGPGIYIVSDRGPAVCPNGDAGHAVHLTARDHNRRHQLSDVIVDLKWMRFCSVRMTLTSLADDVKTASADALGNGFCL